MFSFIELNKRTYSFYEKNTYEEIERGDIGNKVFVGETAFITETKIETDYIIYEYSDTDIIVNIETKTSLKAQGTLIKNTSGEVKSSSRLNSESRLVLVNSLEVDILGGSDLEANLDVLISLNADIVASSSLEVTDILRNVIEKGGAFQIFSIMEKNFYLDVVMGSNNFNTEEGIEEEYHLEAIFPSYKRELIPYEAIRPFKFEALEKALYLDLEYNKLFCYERSIEI